MAQEHRGAVQAVVFSSHDVRLAYTVPVERARENGFEEVAVREVVGPLTLSLETACDRIPTACLLLEPKLIKFRVSNHKVPGDEGHLDAHLPVVIFLGPRSRLAIDVRALFAV